MFDNPKTPIAHQNNLNANIAQTVVQLKMVVTPLSQLKSTINRYNPSHMLTLLSPNSAVYIDKKIPQQNHHILFFNDINQPRAKLIAPQMHDVKKIIAAAQQWHLTQDAHFATQPNAAVPSNAAMLIHCQMGISRSTAAAYIIACALNHNIDEEALAINLRELSPSATPNAQLIALADDYLKRNGKMVAAIKRIGRGAEAREGTPFILPIPLSKQ